MVDPRGPADVSTPGRNTTKFNAFRETSGRLVICSLVMVDDTVADCVCTSSVPPLTSTVSSRFPTSNVALRLPGVAASSRTLLMTAVLNPLSATVTV